MKLLRDVEAEEKVSVKKIEGGKEVIDHLEDIGIKEGAGITLSTIETFSPTPIKGRYAKAQIGDEVITIGHGVAEKVWVE